MKTLLTLAAVTLLVGNAYAGGTNIRLRGDVPGLATKKNALGPADANQVVPLTIVPKTRNPQKLAALTRKLNEGKGGQITPAQWQAEFAATPEQLNDITKWAEAQGLKASVQDGNVQVTGTAAQMEKTFKTPILKFSQPGVEGVEYSNTENPSVPRNLPIKAVLGLNDFRVAFPGGVHPIVDPNAK